MIRILLVDDHASSRQPLAYLLNREDDMFVIAEAGSVAEASRLLSNVDIAVVDLKLPDGSGIDIIQKLRVANREASVLALTASEDRMDMALAVEAGASGVLHKSVPIREIISAIRRLCRGEQIHSTAEIIELFRIVSQRRKQDDFMKQALDTLTAREREVLQALVWGFSDKEIAQYLNIGPRTARSHMANILGKLQVESRLQAVIVAIRCGVVSLDERLMPAPNGFISHLAHDFVHNQTEV